MNSLQNILDGLHQKAFQKEIERTLERVSVFSKKKDSEILDLEVAIERNDEEERILKARLQAQSREQKTTNALLSQLKKERDLRELQKNLLSDFLSLLSCKLFQESAKGAEFFTMNASEFALRLGIGEMMLEECMKTSYDGFCFSLNEKKFCAILGLDGKYYFHPEEVDTNTLLSEISETVGKAGITL